MKAVILSAGQGKRLLPLTADNPKCLVKIDGQSLIEWQIDELARCGVDRVSIVVGYHADRVKQLLHQRYDSQRIRTVYNPTYSWTDNLFSCWAARAEMTEDFVLLNGDTLFEAAVLKRLLEAPDQPVRVVTHKKRYYDAHDMKVTLDRDRLIDELAQLMPVRTLSTSGLQWCEVDFPVDLKHAQRVVRACAAGGEPRAFPQTGFAWG